ncbi:MAG: fumarylacetoacetate hydrolase family protein [Bacteroidota bacterium]
MTASETIEQAALQLRTAAENHTPCPPVRELIGAEDLAVAYAVQSVNTALRTAGGARVVGKKIGLTSPAVQQQLGVDQPDYGVLFADMQVQDGGTFRHALSMQPKAEAEIAFVLGKDLSGDNLTEADVVAAIDYAVATIEIAGSRVANWDIRITDTIADNASASHFVLGTQRVALADLDVVGCRMVMERNGAVVSEGSGAACMGSPLTATLWLAQTMADLGQPLKAGEVVLSGALGPMVAPEPGDAFTANIEGLGTVSVTFSE